MVATPYTGIPAWHAGQSEIPAPRTPQAALRDQVGEDLQRAAARYPLFDRAHLPALALTLSAHLPAARREDRAVVGLVSLWIIAFDTLVDEGDDDPAMLDGLVARFGALCVADQGPDRHAAPPAGAIEQLSAALREIAAGLLACAPSPALRAWWAGSFRATIAAIVRQRELGRRGGRLPGYDALLPLLLDSIGVRPYLAAGAIAGRERGLAARLPALRDLASECALAIRLANDLRTWRKDEFEGQINALVALRAELLRAEPRQTTAAAHDRALALLAERRAISLARCRVRLAASDRAGEAEAGMVRVASAAAGIYATHDYHTYRATGD